MLSPDFLNTAVPLGMLGPDGTFRPLGSGVLVERHGLSWLVTARHVRDAGENGADDGTRFVLVGTTKEEDHFPMDLRETAETHDLEWIETAEEEDLAAMPVPLSPEWVHRTIPESLCLTGDAVIPSMPCYTIGIPYGFASADPGRITPLVLDGVISGVDKEDGLLYISAPTFKGNSGGPAFVYRSPFTAGGNLQVGPPTVLFAGLVIQQMLVRGAATPDEAVSSPPLHLGLVRNAERVLGLLDGSRATELASRLTDPQSPE